MRTDRPQEALPVTENTVTVNPDKSNPTCSKHGEIIPLHNGTCPWCPEECKPADEPIALLPNRTYYTVQRAREATLLFHLDPPYREGIDP